MSQRLCRAFLLGWTFGALSKGFWLSNTESVSSIELEVCLELESLQMSSIR